MVLRGSKGEELAWLLKVRRNKPNRLLRLVRGGQHSEVHGVHLSRNCQSVGCEQRYQEPCASCTRKLGVMAVRLPISMDIKHKKYTGEYEIDRGVLHVFFEGRNRSSAVTGPNPELLARLLLIELVFQAPSWREPNALSSESCARPR